MKKLTVILSLFLMIVTSVSAQNININVNVNLDKQPAWGPSGYEYAEFYYFPDVNIYYDVTNTLFYYLSSGKWISNRYLPDKYRKYDLYSMYKAVLNEKKPWLQNKKHKKSYSQYKGDKTQEAIRYSNDSRYNSSKQNRKQWVNTNASENRNRNSMGRQSGR